MALTFAVMCAESVWSAYYLAQAANGDGGATAAYAAATAQALASGDANAAANVSFVFL